MVNRVLNNPISSRLNDASTWRRLCHSDGTSDVILEQRRWSSSSSAAAADLLALAG
jgi:hypothetical protein